MISRLNSTIQKGDPYLKNVRDFQQEKKAEGFYLN